VEVGASAPSQLGGQAAKELPNRPFYGGGCAAPWLPGVVREPGGGLMISASGEQRKRSDRELGRRHGPRHGSVRVDHTDDSVETMNVYQTPYLSEYGGLRLAWWSVETHRGGDKWKWELNDPFPDFRIRSYHMRGVKDATPRVNFEGPIIPHKLYLSEGFEYETRKIEVYTRPFPTTRNLEEGLNSFTPVRLDSSRTNTWSPPPFTGPTAPGPREHGLLQLRCRPRPDATSHSYPDRWPTGLPYSEACSRARSPPCVSMSGLGGKADQDLTVTPTGQIGGTLLRQQ